MTMNPTVSYKPRVYYLINMYREPDMTVADFFSSSQTFFLVFFCVI